MEENDDTQCKPYDYIDCDDISEYMDDRKSLKINRSLKKNEDVHEGEGGRKRERQEI